MKTSHKFTAITFVVALSLGSFALADESTLKHSDKSFIQDAYKGGLAEVKYGELAERKTANADVKKFAEKLVADHSANNTELKTLADAKKVEVAKEAGMTTDGKVKMLDAKTGPDFDKAWIEAMVKDHKDDIKEFEKESNEAADPEVKAFAAKTLPTLKLHLSIAEGVWDKLGRDK